jgi:hypothetical protein
MCSGDQFHMDSSIHETGRYLRFLIRPVWPISISLDDWFSVKIDFFKKLKIDKSIKSINKSTKSIDKSKKLSDKWFGGNRSMGHKTDR